MKTLEMPRLIQCNLARCWQAQHLLDKQVKELGAQICAISEPRRVPKSQFWLKSKDGLAAVRWEKDKAGNICKLVQRARKFVAVKYLDIYVVSCYLSPNIDRADVQDALDELRDLIVQLGHRVVVCGDFNGKSTEWGNSFTCPRGRLIEEWAAELDLCLLNEGSTPTCVRPQGWSVVDLTWCTPDLSGEVSNWRVRDDVESLSDHQYIEFDIGWNRGSAGRPVGPTYPRWTRGEWDVDSFQAVAHWELGHMQELDEDIEKTSNKMKRIIQDSCDAAAKRLKPHTDQKQVFWWNESIACSRRRAIRARRNWTKAKIRFRNSTLVQELREVYRVAKRELRGEINKAKANAWQDLIKDLDNDPWGLSYRIVLEKLRPAGPALTEVLEDDVLRRTLTQLFPQNEDPIEVEVEEALPITNEEEVGVSVQELINIIKNIRKKNKAPGRDGIPLKALSYLPEEGLGVMADLFSRCMKEGKFPNEWKRALLVLIPKEMPINEGNPRVRPICLLDELGKLLETVIVNRIWTWMEDNRNSQLAQEQYGFRKGRSTCDALLVVRNEIRRVTDQGGWLLQ